MCSYLKQLDDMNLHKACQINKTIFNKNKDEHHEQKVQSTYNLKIKEIDSNSFTLYIHLKYKKGLWINMIINTEKKNKKTRQSMNVKND